MKYLAILALLFSVNANAGVVTATWTNPTTCVDATTGAAVGTCDPLASNRIEWGTCTTATSTVFSVKVGEDTTPGPVTTWTSAVQIPPGRYCFRVFATDTDGDESNASNVVAKVVPTDTKPVPPVMTSVIATVSELRKTAAGVWWVVRAVGYAPIGTECTGDALLRDYYRVEPTQLSVNPALITGVFATRCVAS